ncbi:MAG: HAMP domain-containing histidine kinase [Deltaproteobacteria bacterium]|nr:HAMP domain-containing histidine kinase [Deltaproteobacteria bacterium]
MTHNRGPIAKNLRQRLFKVITPVTLTIVILTAIIVIGAARLLIFPLYTDTVSILLENLARNINTVQDSPRKIEEILRAASSNGKFSCLLGNPEKIEFNPTGLEKAPELMRQATGLLTPGQRSRVVISGFGPSLRLLGVIQVSANTFLVISEDSHSFAVPYMKIFMYGFILVMIGVGLAVGISSRMIFAPLWARMEELEDALRRYGQGHLDQRLNLDENIARDGFLLVYFEFNRMADTIEALAREKEKRAQAERTWLAGLAHDLNTPMTIMRGHAENLVEHGHDLTAAERRQRLSEILVQALYMQALVDDLLTQATARLATLKLTPERIELAGLYDILIDTFHYPAQRKGVILIADDGGLSVTADALRLRQILVNLIRNALTHAGSLNCIELLAERAGRGVLIIVQDDGSGIDPDQAETIFNSGQRGNTSRVKGWGLGLAVVKMLAEAHGGACRVKKGPEGGARFEIWFPDEPVRCDRIKHQPENRDENEVCDHDRENSAG